MAVLPSEMNMKTCAKCHLMMRSLYFKIAKMKKKSRPKSLTFKLCYVHKKKNHKMIFSPLEIC